MNNLDFDVPASSHRNERYWMALRKKAMSACQLSSAEGLPVRSLLWPTIIYGRKALSAAEISRSIEGEASMVDRFIAAESAQYVSRLGISQPTGWSYIDLPRTSELPGRIGEALGLIGRVWPEALQELARTVVAVVFVRSGETRISAMSDPKKFGLIHMNEEKYAHAPIEEIATALVHEVGHHSLFAITSVDPLLSAGIEQSIYSHIRRENRPAIGVLHGVFATYRMLNWAERLVQADEDRWAPESARIEQMYRHGMGATLDELLGLAVTKDGERLLGQIRNYNLGLKSFLQGQTCENR